MVTITLTREQHKLLSKTITGPPSTWGGFQRLIVKLQALIRYDRARGWVLTITDEDALSIIRYSKPSYGQGTYQKILRSLEAEVLPQLPPEAVQLGLPLE